MPLRFGALRSARDEHVFEVLARAPARTPVHVPLVALLKHELGPFEDGTRTAIRVPPSDAVFNHGMRELALCQTPQLGRLTHRKETVAFGTTAESHRKPRPGREHPTRREHSRPLTLSGLAADAAEFLN
jgi:hypothetical protein